MNDEFGPIRTGSWKGRKASMPRLFIYLDMVNNAQPGSRQWQFSRQRGTMPCDFMQFFTIGPNLNECPDGHSADPDGAASSTYAAGLTFRHWRACVTGWNSMPRLTPRQTVPSTPNYKSQTRRKAHGAVATAYHDNWAAKKNGFSGRDPTLNCWAVGNIRQGTWKKARGGIKPSYSIRNLPPFVSAAE